MFIKLKQKFTAQISPEEFTDEQLVAAYLSSGNKDMVALLFERYTHLVYGICLNYLQDQDQCKDAVMEIFEGLFQKLSVHKVMNFRNWLYSVTRNHCLMIIRRAGYYNKVKTHARSYGTDAEFPDYMSEEDDLMYSKGVILSAVEQLSAEQGTCIRLMYIDDKSYHEISDITGYSLNEVKSHIQNGKRNMKNYLLKQDGNTKR
jgi:RNA polymerase sigma factor (sigma-70 family)